MEELPNGVGLASVDCVEERSLAVFLGVRGFPTVLFIEDNLTRLRKYEGDRTLDSLRAFASGGWREAPLYDPEVGFAIAYADGPAILRI